MSVFTLDQILETDQFVVQEIFELMMDEPGISQDLQCLVSNEFEDSQVYEVTRNNRTYM